MDEIVALIEDTGQGPITYYYLQDANYNVVGLTNETGSVVTQYTYEPYGGLVAVERVTGAPRNAVGFQGLFFERLYRTNQVTGPPLVTSQTGLYYVRNRWYRPEIGRFLQRDMNESALLVLGAMAMNGQAPGAAVSGFDAQSHYGDGMNLYQYLGSNPVNRRDPTGLSFLDTLGAAASTAALTGLMWAGNSSAVALIGNVLIAANLYAMATDPEYAMMATSLPGGVGMLNYDIQAILKFGTSLGAAAKAAMSSEALAWRVAQGAAGISRAAGPAAEWIQCVGKFGTYSQLSRLTKGFNHAIEAHKILEWRHVPAHWPALRMDDIPSVILTQAEHVRVSNGLYAVLGRMRAYTRAEIWQAYQNAYRELGHAEWLQYIERFFQ